MTQVKVRAGQVGPNLCINLPTLGFELSTPVPPPTHHENLEENDHQTLLLHLQDEGRVMFQESQHQLQGVAWQGVKIKQDWLKPDKIHTK